MISYLCCQLFTSYLDMKYTAVGQQNCFLNASWYSSDNVCS